MTVVSSFGPEADHPFRPHPNVRYPRSCGVCRRIPEVHPGPKYRERDKRAEAAIGALAAQAAGLPEQVSESLHEYADARAWDIGVRVEADWKDEARQEFGDGFNYLVWDIERWLPGVEAGDNEALEEYGKSMNALAALMVVWQRLHAR
jgi:hypothetical protein